MIQGAFFKVDTLSHLDERLVFFSAEVKTKLEQHGSASWKFVEDTRTAQQNRYLWGWLYRHIAQSLEDGGIVIPADDGTEYPYTKDLLHEIFRDMFLCRGTIVFKGKERKQCWSTTELGKNPKEYEAGGTRPSFTWYVDEVKQFVWQHWLIEVPEPSNRDYPDLMPELAKAA